MMRCLVGNQLGVGQSGESVEIRIDNGEPQNSQEYVALSWHPKKWQAIWLVQQILEKLVIAEESK